MAEPTSPPPSPPSGFKPSILANIDRHVEESLDLAPDEKAKVVATSDNAGVRIGAAVEVTEELVAGGHVEKDYARGWGWFAGFKKRWLKSK